MRADNYSLGILCTTLTGIGLSIGLLLLHGFASITAPLWLLILVCAGTFILTVSQLVSGIGYICRGFDTLTHEKTALNLLPCNPSHKPPTRFKERINFQFIGIVFGIMMAVAVVVAMKVLHTSLPFVGVLGNPLSSIISFVGFASTFGGLGNRLGRVLDYMVGRDNAESQPFFRRPHVNYVLGVIGGAIGGITLAVLVLCTMNIAPILLFFGAAPAWMAKILFAILTISVCASASGYIGRAFDSLLGNRTLVGAMYDVVTEREIASSLKARFNKEAVLTIVGLFVGIALGSIFIHFGILTVFVPYIHLSKNILAILLMATFASSVGGLCNRWGSMMDRFCSEENALPNASSSSGPIGHPVAQTYSQIGDRQPLRSLSCDGQPECEESEKLLEHQPNLSSQP